MSVTSLERALRSLLRPVLLLSPFRHLPEHLFSVVLPLVLIGGHHPPSRHLPSGPGGDQPWAHLFYSLLSLLSLTPHQFDHDLLSIPRVVTKWPKPNHTPQNVPLPPFVTRQTVFLRVLIPRTGFSGVICALIDTGAGFTVVKSELARLLIANGAPVRYTWPAKTATFAGFKKINRTLDGSSLLLQSVEDEAVCFSPTLPISIVEWEAFAGHRIDMFKVARLFNSRGVFQSVTEKWESVINGNEKDTIWTGEVQESLASSGYRIDMIIGRDLQDRFVFVHPRQPTYYLTSSFSFIRTKLGLTFSGWLETQMLENQWEVTPEIARRIELILYPEKYNNNSDRLPLPTGGNVEKKEELSLLSPHTQAQLNRMLTFKMSDYPVTWMDCYHCLLSLLLYLHLIVLLLFSLLIAFFFQSVITVSFSRHIPLFQKMIISHYSAFLGTIIKLLGCTIDPQLMHFSVDTCLPLTVTKKGEQQNSRTVNAFLDSGSGASYISSQLVKEMKMETSDTEDDRYKLVNLTLSTPYLPLENEHKNISNRKSNEVYLFQKESITAFTNVFGKRILPVNLVSSIAHLLDIPLHPPALSPSSQTTRFDLLIGTDLLNTVLAPRYNSPRVITLLPNLSAHETRFGYYLQGTQSNHYLSCVLLNWKLNRFNRFSNKLRWLPVCLLVDTLLALLYLNFNDSLTLF